VTPWFAAGMGFVIAAGLWLYSPHAMFDYPNAIGRQPCQVKGCPANSGGPDGGSVATVAPGVELKHEGSGPGGKTAQPDTGTSPRSDLTFGYAVLWQHHGQFQVVLSVSGGHIPASWTLSFTMPGTQIKWVWGAQWQPSADNDGGTASAPQSGYGRAADSSGIRLMVSGVGQSTMPSGCTFDGAACQFTNVALSQPPWR
jgi:hypothetical protein